ncbi:MAG: SpoVA/SpoVAEb family sporulation membrane protein [Clostridiales bacterium]|nr:SpoVA/SpoVAEb family sporulation membrane protein [Clostridiales bacterium]
MAKKPQIAPHYAQIVKDNEPKRPLAANCLKAFAVGGGLCVLSQALREIFLFRGMSANEATAVYLVILIGLTALVTGLGFYDKWAQWAGAGLGVPITGFANSMTSAAMEHRSEGFVLGVGCNAFKLAGAVIVFGSVSAFFFALIKWMLGVL